MCGAEEPRPTLLKRLARTCPDQPPSRFLRPPHHTCSVSFSVAVFFATLMPFAWLAPITHLGGWLVKVLLYVLILGLSFLIHNDAMLQYAEVARGFSVIFLLAQVLIIIDFCYNMHEFIVRKMDSTDESLTSQGYVVGICSNGWRNIYITISMILILGSLAALGALYYYLGNCPLHNFFISETLIIGVVFTLVSMMNIIGKGLLPPAIMFAYNTYLVYGAMTNNPDSKCNPELAMLTSNEAAIYSGLVITVLSVTWMAYSSANSMPGAVRMDGQPHSVDNPAVTAGTPVQEWTGKSKTNGHGADEKSPVGTAAAYQADDDEESGKSSRSPALPSSSAAGRHPADDTEASLAAEKPWIFHLVMCLAGMYLAMMVTNWSTPDAATASAAAAGNPEVSAASMWARIGSQWAIHVIYLWTMMAPTCCPGRDFSQ